MSAVFAALLGALAGGLIAFQVARRNIKDQFFYAAAAKLKQSFTDILRLLREPNVRFEIIDEFTIDAMDNSFGEHERAVIEFTYALPKWQRDSFSRAWESYRGKETGHDKMKRKYFNQLNWQQAAHKDIESILAFTEPSHFPFFEELKSCRKKK